MIRSAGRRERFSFVSDASWAKKSDAFFKNALSNFNSEFSLRNRANSTRSVSLRAPTRQPTNLRERGSATTHPERSGHAV